MSASRKIHFLTTPAFAVLGRAGGILIPFLIAFYFGADSETDAFFFAFTIIVSLAGLFSPIFESLLVPYLVEKRDSISEASSLSNGVLVFILPLILLLVAGIWLFLSGSLNHLSGLDASSAALSAEYFFEMAPFLIFWILAAQSNAHFYTFKVFWFPAFSPFIRSVVAIVFLVLFHETLGLHALTNGFSFGEILRWGVGLFLLLKLAKWASAIDWKKSFAALKDFLSQAWFHLGGLISLNLIPLTDQWFASWLGVGNLSLISYADRLFQIPFQLMLVGFLQIFLSYWSETFYHDSPQSFWEKVWKDIRVVFLICLFFSLGLILLRVPVVDVLFGWGGMNVENRRELAGLFAWLMLGFAPAILNLLYVRILFVMKKSSVFLVQSLIRLVLNIILNYIFIRIWGLQGLAISTAAVFLGSTLWLHAYLHKQRSKGGAG